MSDEELTVSPTVYRLPRSHYHCTLENFEWASVRPKTAQVALLAFLRRVQGGEAPHLILTGPPGAGKTHLGVASYRWAVARLGSVLATWINVPVFCERVKTGFSDATADPWQDYESATRLVVLDDLFGRDLTQFEANTLVYRLIDTAYQSQAAVIVTMNQDIQELAARLAQHEISRLLADSQIMPLTSAKDYRR